RDLERAEKDWRVPGDDRADHADRLAQVVVEDRFAERDRLALQLRGEAAEVAEHVGAVDGLGPRLGADRVAGLRRDQPAEAFDVGLEVLGDPGDHPAPLAGRRPLPAGKGGRRGLDGPVDVGRAATGRLAYDRPVAWALDLDGAAVGGLRPLAADQHPADSPLDLDHRAASLLGTSSMCASASK